MENYDPVSESECRGTLISDQGRGREPCQSELRRVEPRNPSA